MLHTTNPPTRVGSPNNPNHLSIHGLGLDLVRPLRKAPSGYTHVLVTINKFKKSIEAWSITKITSNEVVKFVTNIIHCFGVPNSIITDNNTQFTGSIFLEFNDKYPIYVNWTTVAHPCANGQVERANDMILQGLKHRVFTCLKRLG